MLICLDSDSVELPLREFHQEPNEPLLALELSDCSIVSRASRGS